MCNPITRSYFRSRRRLAIAIDTLWWNYAKDIVKPLKDEGCYASEIQREAYERKKENQKSQEDP